MSNPANKSKVAASSVSTQSLEFDNFAALEAENRRLRAENEDLKTQLESKEEQLYRCLQASGAIDWAEKIIKELDKEEVNDEA